MELSFTTLKMPKPHKHRFLTD